MFSRSFSVPSPVARCAVRLDARLQHSLQPGTQLGAHVAVPFLGLSAAIARGAVEREMLGVFHVFVHSFRQVRVQYKVALILDSIFFATPFETNRSV